MTSHAIPAFPDLTSRLMRLSGGPGSMPNLPTDWHSSDRHGSLEVIMNDACSLSISVGIIAFGIWIAVGAIGVGAHLAWMLMGLLPIIVGTISLYLAIREVKVAPRN
jgi:hypothetical protein